MNFSQIKAVVADMDGVLWRGDTPLPGMTDFFDLLRARSLPFALATNNSSKTPANYVEKLARLGVNGIEEHQIITSATATADYLSQSYPAGTRVHVVGMTGLREALTGAGFKLVDDDVELVVAGADFDWSYAKARTATLLIRAGAKFIGTNPDTSFPSPEGLVPGTGSILAMLEAASGVTPVVIGKPKKAMFETALRRLGTTPDETLMIGDRLGTDIEGGINAGLKTAMVMTGVTTRDELDASDIKPDAVFDGLPELLATWHK